MLFFIINEFNFIIIIVVVMCSYDDVIYIIYISTN